MPSIPPSEPFSQKKKCIACREWIETDASLCPQCQSPQSRSKLQFIGDILKWSGGITVIISLLVGVVQVNTLFQNWQERQKTIMELVKGADIQANSEDYAGAWQLYEQALQLEPGSQLARSGQVMLAMNWLKNIRTRNEGTFSEIVVKVVPVLYRGTASATGKDAANLFAHIAWANFLRHREGHSELKVDAHFARALKIDPDNVYAHTMWGFWMLWQGKALDKVNQHFSAALKTGLDPEYVRDLQLSGLNNVIYDNRGEQSYRHLAANEMIHILNDIRKNKEAIKPRRRTIRNLFSRAYYSISWFQNASTQLASSIPPEEQLATFHWIKEINPSSLKYQNLIDQYWIARFTEDSGKHKKALALYRKLQSELESTNTSQSIIGLLRKEDILGKSIARLSKND